MAKSIISIGYRIPGHDELGIEFWSKSSLMDADIVLFSPTLPNYEKSSAGNGYYNGKTAYGESGSPRLLEDMARWKRELQNALKMGKTIFFLLDEKNDFWIDTGKRSYSGTGRNRRTTVHFGISNNYEVIPSKIGVIHSAQGKEVVSRNHPVFKEFFDYFRSYLFYKVYLEEVESGTILFTGKDKDKVLGLYQSINSGNLVFLPYIVYEEDKFLRTKINSDGEEVEYWNNKGVEFGKVLVSNLLKISSALTHDNARTPTPTWVVDGQYKNSKELAIEEQVNTKNKELISIQDEIQKLNRSLSEAQVLKGLLFEQGKPLEISVIKALELLGFKAENYDDGTLELDQVITSPEGYRYIGECEGKDEKDIDISKFRQLLESMNADFHRDDVTEKALGILFGNAQRLKAPSDRKLDFTQKCKIGAEREKIALVKTQDLFLVASYLLENLNSDFQKACRDAIYNNLGKVVEFPQIPVKDQLPV